MRRAVFGGLRDDGCGWTAEHVLGMKRPEIRRRALLTVGFELVPAEAFFQCPRQFRRRHAKLRTYLFGAESVSMLLYKREDRVEGFCDIFLGATGKTAA